MMLMVVSPLGAADLDVAGLGRDLNGWTERNVAAYGCDGSVFELDRPVVEKRDDGSMAVRAQVREVSRAGVPFEAKLRLEVSPDGLVRSVGIDGKVDGRAFDAGTATRPEPVATEPAGNEADAADEATPAANAATPPLDPGAELRKDAGDRLASALERARSSGKGVKRDLSSWLLGGRASDDATLVQGVALALDRLIRRTGG